MNTSILSFSYLLLELFPFIFVDLVVDFWNLCVLLPFADMERKAGREELPCPESETWETQPELLSAVIDCSVTFRACLHA